MSVAYKIRVFIYYIWRHYAADTLLALSYVMLFIFAGATLATFAAPPFHAAAICLPLRYVGLFTLQRRHVMPRRYADVATIMPPLPRYATPLS